MKTKIFTIIIILISLLSLNQVKADTIYVNLNNIEQVHSIATNIPILTFCQNDTLKIFHSQPQNQYPNQYEWWNYETGMIFDYSPYIIMTQNSIKCLNNDSTWITWNENSNGLWVIGSDPLLFFYIYFTEPITEEIWDNNEGFVCGTSDTLYASPDSHKLGIKYTWFLNGDTVASGYYPQDTSYIATSSGTYVLEISGCNTIKDTIVLTMVDNTPPNLGGDQLYCSSTGVINYILHIQGVDPDGAYQSWTWSDGTSNDFINITQAGLYWIEVSNACLTNVRDSINVTITVYPSVQILGQRDICPGGTTELCTNFDFEVSMWYQVINGVSLPLPGGSMTNCVNVSDSMKVRVFVAEGDCPPETFNVQIKMTTPYQNNKICVATVDTNNYNKVIWNRVYGKAIESYNIYRLNPNGYQIIGNVPFENDPIFYDLNANPMTSANRYKIAAIDTCGNESALSFYHGTIHITMNTSNGVDLTITDRYLDESGIYSPSKYYILIDSLNNGNLTIMDSLNAVYNSYHIENPLANATYAMGVALPWACDGSKNGSKDIQTLSISNKTEALPTNINLVKKSKISIHPNPSSGIFHIDGDYNSVEVFNAIGQSILLTEKTKSIDLSNFEKGIYFVKIKTIYGPSIQKIVIQ